MTLDDGLERSIRGALVPLRPEHGAPSALRARVLSIPATDPVVPAWLRLVRTIGVPVAAAGLAGAAVAVATFGLTRAPLVGVPANDVGAVAPGFDPSIQGMGLIEAVLPTASLAGAALAISGALVAGRELFGSRVGTNRGRVMILLGLVAIVAGIVLTRLDVGLSTGSIRGAPLNYVEAPAGPLHDDIVWMSTAAAGEPTVGVISLRNTAAIPVRIEGFVVPGVPEIFVPGYPTGLWMPEGGAGYGAPGVDQIRPFEPVTLLPTEELNVYVAGRAGPCAFGPTFDPTVDYPDGTIGGYSYVVGPTVTVAYSVFGLTTTADVEIQEIFAEPSRGGCTG